MKTRKHTHVNKTKKKMYLKIRYPERVKRDGCLQEDLKTNKCLLLVDRLTPGYLAICTGPVTRLQYSICYGALVSSHLKCVYGNDYDYFDLVYGNHQKVSEKARLERIEEDENKR